MNAAVDYGTWPRLPELAARASIPGLTEMRREALIDEDRDQLAKRMRRYFNTSETLPSLQTDNCGPVHEMARFKAARAREHLLSKEHFQDSNLRRYYQRVFDHRWCYYTKTRANMERATA